MEQEKLLVEKKIKQYKTFFMKKETEGDKENNELDELA